MGTRRRRSGIDGRNNRKRSVARQAAGWVLLAVGCFAFGFFVVSYMIPTTAASDPAGAQSHALPPSKPDGAAIDNQAPRHNEQMAMQPQAHLPRQDENTGASRSPKFLSPSIEPETDPKTQQPQSLDSSPKLNTDDTPSTADTTGKTDPAKTDASTPDPAKTDTERADALKSDPLLGRRRRRRHKPATSDTTPQQTPTSLDATAPGTSTPTSPTQPPPDSTSTNLTAPSPASTAPATTTSSDTPAPTRSRYRVQAGIFSTQDAANELAQKLKDKGFAATVQAYDQDGRTLYRVQHAVYRHRSNAEAEQRKLSDAGFDATTVKGD